MVAVKIPPGIYPVKWRNKKEKGIQERYRVKVKRKEYQADKLFDTLDEAITFLDNLKSPKGREAMAKEDAVALAKKEAVLDWLKNPNLGWYLDKYFDTYASRPDPEDKNSVKARSFRTTEYLKEGIKKTEIAFLPKAAAENIATPRLGRAIRNFKSTVRKFGDIRLIDIDDGAASAYVRARSRHVSPPTVRREISMLGSMYSKLKFMDKKAWEVIGKRNPFLDADLTPLDRVTEGRDESEGRLDAEGEDRLFAVLAESKKRGFKEPSLMLQIVTLALCTGMRRGELLELEWSRVKQDRIVLRTIDTKTRRPRWIPVSDDVRAILDTIPKREGKDRLFEYTPDGFAANWRRVRAKAEIGAFRFHDTRREFISRCLEQLSASPVVVARRVGMASVAHVEKAYVEPHNREKMIENGIESERDVMRAVGHTRKATTSHYYALNTAGKGKTKDEG